MIKALQFIRSIPRYALMRFLGSTFPSLYTSRFAPVVLRDIPEPELPNQQWVRIAPKLVGICGSDLATLTAKGSPYLSSVTSMPFVLGHELVGTITEVGTEVESIDTGDRVVLQPALGCQVRGIEPACDACRAGRYALCDNVTRGSISAGIQTGYCKDTGGGFSENLVAHFTQVYRVPDSIDDLAAVLVEPFSCALHGVLRAEVKDEDTVFVLGCGSIGLLTIAALRATGCKARIVASALLPHQKEHATNLGADVVLHAGGSTSDRYARWAKELDARTLRPEMGKPTVIGGAGVTFDCVASSQTLDDCIRFTKSGGTLVLVGMPGIPSGVDWTPLWFKELTVKATYAYALETQGTAERHTFEIAIDLLREWGPKLAPLVGKPYPLADYRRAFAAALQFSDSKAVKTVIAIR